MKEMNPAQMVERATPDTAEEIAGRLVQLLSDPEMPEAMREDIRSRLADLYRRFPLVAEEGA